MTVNIKIIFFAKAREIAGRTHDNLEIDCNISYQLLLNIIVKKFGLDNIKDTIILALNEDYCDTNKTYTLKTGDEIAVIPPLSGG
ncbi:molybdopterin synthase sulfur carrier subunit [Aethina tumida]|uniref:molybdopterin synthase sulfur carrier subunit n=1 Tax=Aethina tumida TaxID=116153 RepID=UPI00096B26D3|nr:molybdopterin synthase sulfur carrier subunit [Aethina tumida]